MRAALRVSTVVAVFLSTAGLKTGGSMERPVFVERPVFRPAEQAGQVKFEKVYPLKPEEGVFAYARISPNGQFLAYASEDGNARTVTVVDLKTQKILFTEPGIDAYWSNDGTRIIYSSFLKGGVAIWHRDTGEVARNVAPGNLGDYYSWAVRDGKNLILTISSNYYYLDGDQAVMPHSRVGSCQGYGQGERPLISHDGMRITTFVRGTVVVRNLSDCESILDTGIQGAKADFSWDGRYVAFHVARADKKSYEIQIVDTQKRTVRTLAGLKGSALFPSWTADGRMNFRYDGDDYRGFITATNVLSLPERPLTTSARPQVATTNAPWTDLFPETPAPAHRANFVMIWATWSAHSPQALKDLQRAGAHFDATAADVGVYTALEIGSLRADVDRMRRANQITLPEIPLAPDRLARTEALNQIPTTLLFRDGKLVDRRLGAQTYDELVAWAKAASPPATAAR